MTLTRIALLIGFLAVAGCGGVKQATMDTTTIWALILATLSILLGFVALLTSRIYLVKDSNVEVEVPVFGKLKANYPAVIFVFFGALLAWYGLKTHNELAAQQIEAQRQLDISKASAPGDDEWSISGRLLAPGGKPIDWGRGVFTLIFGSPQVKHTAAGGFEIHLRIKHGQDFEEYVQQIDYTHDRGSAKIFPKKELDAYRASPSSSRLLEATPTTRVYKPMQLEVFEQ
jgi:hypothetical protein